MLTDLCNVEIARTVTGLTKIYMYKTVENHISFSCKESNSKNCSDYLKYISKDIYVKIPFYVILSHYITLSLQADE